MTGEVSIGVIIEIRNDKILNFLIDNEIELKINSIVGIKSDDFYVLAIVQKIDVKYFLDDSEQFFISRAATNSLQNLNGNKIKYGKFVEANIIGTYKLSKKNQFVITEISTSRYTPEPLQKVYVFDSYFLSEVYGLNSEGKKTNNISLESVNKKCNYKNSIPLGNIIYPFYDEAYASLEVFKNKHSLITGATGSGKSWFLAHLINHLASNDGHVVILDPHDEYRFLIDKNRNYEVNFFCKSLININKDENKINYLKYFLANKYLNSAILNAVLPNISPNAMQQIEEIFNEDLSQVQLKSLNIDEIIKLIMGRIKKSEAQGYINNITYKPNDLNTLTLLYYGLIERMEQLKEKGLFQSKIPSWLESKTKCIDIIQEDYSFSDYGKRIIRALIHQFLRFKAEDFLKIFIVEEAHQLLSFNNIEDKLLLSMLLREARKFNTSIIFVTQNYYDVPEELRSQFSNIIQFREPLDKDANYFQDRLCKIKLANSNVSFLLRTPDLKVD